MIQKLKNEIKNAGSNLYTISAALVAALILFAIFAGDLLDLSSLGFEVIFPFFTAIAIGEWGKTKADDNYDVIAAQSKSVFRWVTLRYIAIMGMVSLFAVVGLIAASFIRNEMPVWELLLTYFPTALCLSSLSLLIGVRYSQEHIATLVCGVVWLVGLMARSLLRLPFVEYIYPFIRFAGDPGGIWLVNKAVLCAVSFLLWCMIYRTCKR